MYKHRFLLILILFGQIFFYISKNNKGESFGKSAISIEIKLLRVIDKYSCDMKMPSFVLT